MSKYHITIIQSIYENNFEKLKELIREFAINVYMVQKFDLDKETNANKLKIINNYKNNLLESELKVLEEDILNRIEFAKQAIQNKTDEKITRYYILLENETVIGFQTAQIRISNNIIEGWRNFAYIKPQYAGKTGIVLDTNGKICNGFLSNSIYENITHWFKENDVTIEKTATGINMYKNILIYIVFKGFIPESVDNERIYLIKDYKDKKSKKELKQIYKNYIDNNIQKEL